MKFKTDKMRLKGRNSRRGWLEVAFRQSHRLTDTVTVTHLLVVYWIKKACLVLYINFVQLWKMKFTIWNLKGFRERLTTVSGVLLLLLFPNGMVNTVLFFFMETFHIKSTIGCWPIAIAQAAIFVASLAGCLYFTKIDLIQPYLQLS